MKHNVIRPSKRHLDTPTHPIWGLCLADVLLWGLPLASCSSSYDGRCRGGGFCSREQKSQEGAFWATFCAITLKCALALFCGIRPELASLWQLASGDLGEIGV
uniref:(northern house mosquito) hypothetical protein n=1 Tax=Culex pipiens TaxID=7175 RepID=A0A8D8BNU3_CULPI